MVVDFGVGEVAALLAEHDQVLEPRLARLGLGRSQLKLAQLDAVLAAFRLAFGERFLGALDGELRCDFAGAELRSLAKNRRGRFAGWGLRFCLAGTLARAFFATGLGGLAFASALGVRLIAGFFIDRDDAVRTVCFATGVLAGRVVFTARFAGLPVALLPLWAAFAPRFQAGLAQPEAITFLAPLALAFAEDFLTGSESFFAMVILPNLGAILAVCPRRDPNRSVIGAWQALRAASLTFSLGSMTLACGSAPSKWDSTSVLSKNPSDNITPLRASRS